MPALYQKSNPKLYEYIKDRNLQSQWFLLETLVEHSVQSKDYKITLEVLLALHFSSSVLLDDTPGALRTGFNHIHKSKHIPPAPNEVRQLLFECMDHVNTNFHSSNPFHLAAYTLWRLTWIHPFNECNGRTARAACYLILCKKFERWLPGKSTIHEIIRENENGYYLGLESADRALAEHGIIDVALLEEYIYRLFYKQITSIP